MCRQRRWRTRSGWLRQTREDRDRDAEPRFDEALQEAFGVLPVVEAARNPSSPRRRFLTPTLAFGDSSRLREFADDMRGGCLPDREATVRWAGALEERAWARARHPDMRDGPFRAPAQVSQSLILRLPRPESHPETRLDGRA